MLALSLLLATMLDDVQVRLATHEGTLLPNAVLWESEILITRTPDAGPHRLALRIPLPEDVEVEGASVERDHRGRIVAILTSTADDRVRLRVRQPRGEALAPPLVPTWERVVLRGGATFRPAPALGLEQRMGHYASTDVGHAERELLDGTFGKVARGPRGPALYLGPETPAALRELGLAGSLRTSGEQQTPLVAAALGIAAVLVGALALASRALAQRAALERADKILDAEWRTLAGK